MSGRQPEPGNGRWPRLIRVAGDEVRAVGVDARGMARLELFAVLILWDSPDPESWLGWLTTTDHRALCFLASDVRDVAFLGWLSELPGWNSDQLTVACNVRGLHQVWRRPNGASPLAAL